MHILHRVFFILLVFGKASVVPSLLGDDDRASLLEEDAAHLTYCLQQSQEKERLVDKVDAVCAKSILQRAWSLNGTKRASLDLLKTLSQYAPEASDALDTKQAVSLFQKDAQDQRVQRIHDMTYHERHLTHVIMPFHVRQMSALAHNLQGWKTLLPCDARSMPSSKIDLVFYISDSLDQVQHEAQLMSMYNELDSDVKRCFGAVQVIHANLPSEHDTHYTGSRFMFEKMMLNVSFPLMRPPSYVLFMEPDCLPIQSNWLAILHTSTIWPNAEFWVRGSNYRGSLSHVSKAKDSILCHWNGNALYSLASMSFRLFYMTKYMPFAADYMSSGKGGGYDMDLYTYLKTFQHYCTIQTIFHMFQYTRLVQNIYRTDYSARQILQNSPDTVLVHSGRNTDDALVVNTDRF